MSRMPHLPLELVLNILESSLPSGGPHVIANPSTPDVQLLVTWAQVCRTTYAPATKCLREHCVYLDTAARLQKFLKCLAASKGLEASTLPPTIPLSSVSSVYLGLDTDSIRSSQIVSLAQDVFIELGGSVRRLILDLPLRRIPITESADFFTNRIFAESLAALVNLEEFVTVGGMPAVDFWNFESDVCRRWPNLRRLAGFQVNLSEEALWHNVARCRNLEQVVISRPYLLRLQRWNIKRSVSEQWNLEKGGDPSFSRPLKIVVADHEFSSPIIDWKDGNIHDPSNLLDVSCFEVTLGWQKRVDHACREWMIEGAKQDTLWDH
ncbi:hypothetical protein FDECE_10431 [Fusarium decemcellulare]|nr:hypothetical protein FDECE_10431 [Fusarium decemcellulare]